jgi:transposase-like protein
MRKRYTDEQRSALVDLVNEEGATVSEAARHLGVTASTAYQWMKRAAEGPEQPRGRSSRAAVPPTFVQVVRATEGAATIAVRVGNAEVQVRRGFDADLFRAVVEALRGDET